MDLLTVVLAVEQSDTDLPADELLDGIREHKDSLRNLQGWWGRFIKHLEDLGEI